MKPEHILDLESRAIGPVRFVDVPGYDSIISGTSKGASGHSIYERWIKRGADIVFTLLIGLSLLPLVALLALLIALDGHNPFYGQRRIGRHGRVFRMWKLRSMVPGAEAALDAYLEANPTARAEWDHHQKLADDPRITRIGRFIRATSFDELPQFWNVLRGDMSVVGPRPMMPDQVALYPGQSYFELRPGITGPWQVSDRHASGFCDRARFDELYARNLSFWTDLRLVVRTVFVVFRGTGC